MLSSFFSFFCARDEHIHGQTDQKQHLFHTTLHAGEADELRKSEKNENKTKCGLMHGEQIGESSVMSN